MFENYFELNCRISSIQVNCIGWNRCLGKKFSSSKWTYQYIRLFKIVFLFSSLELKAHNLCILPEKQIDHYNTFFFMFLTHLLLRRLKRIFTLIKQLCSETKIRRKDVTLHLLQLSSWDKLGVASVFFRSGEAWMHQYLMSQTPHPKVGFLSLQAWMWSENTVHDKCAVKSQQWLKLLFSWASCLYIVEIDYRINPICQYYWKGSLPSALKPASGPYLYPTSCTASSSLAWMRTIAF